MIRFLVGTVVLWFVISIIMGATGIGAVAGLDVDQQGWIAFIAAAVLMGIFSATRRGQSALKFDTTWIGSGKAVPRSIGTPMLPSVDDREALVEWFLRHDPKVYPDVLKWDALVTGFRDAIRDRILDTLRETEGSARALSEEVIEAGSVNQAAMAHLVSAARPDLMASDPSYVPEAAGLSETELSMLAQSETISATRMRILGYFLKEIHGIDPASLV